MSTADKVGINLTEAPITLRHSKLKRSDEESAFRSECPKCEDGILLMRRDPENGFRLMNIDVCTFCGQHFIYDQDEIDEFNSVGVLLPEDVMSCSLCGYEGKIVPRSEKRKLSGGYEVKAWHYKCPSCGEEFTTTESDNITLGVETFSDKDI